MRAVPRATIAGFLAVIIGGFLLAPAAQSAQPKRAPLPRLKVSPDQRFLLKADNSSFLYLGDTAWELFHRLNRKEAATYLRTRADQKFEVVQAATSRSSIAIPHSPQ